MQTIQTNPQRVIWGLFGTLIGLFLMLLTIPHLQSEGDFTAYDLTFLMAVCGGVIVRERTYQTRDLTILLRCMIGPLYLATKVFHYPAKLRVAMVGFAINLCGAYFLRNQLVVGVNLIALYMAYILWVLLIYLSFRYLKKIYDEDAEYQQISGTSSQGLLWYFIYGLLSPLSMAYMAICGA